MTTTKKWWQKLPADHPALNKKGKLSKRAKKVLAREMIDSRTVAGRAVITHNGGGRRVINHYDESGNALKWPVRNTELFYRVADLIELFPNAYDQSQWGHPSSDPTPCGTAFCIAGHGAHEAGFMPLPNNADGFIDFRNGDWEQVYHIDTAKGDLVVPVLEIDAVGEVEFGITATEGATLFGELWRPHGNMTVPEALRALGDGQPLSDVTYWWFQDEDYGDYGDYDYDEDYRDLIKEEEARGTIQTTGVKP